MRSETGPKLSTQGRPKRTAVHESRKWTNGVSTNGVTEHFFMFFDRGTFWVLPLTYYYFPKSARAYLFSKSVEIHYSCSGPISVDPICPQPTPVRGRCARARGSARDPGQEVPGAREKHKQITAITTNKQTNKKQVPGAREAGGVVRGPAPAVTRPRRMPRAAGCSAFNVGNDNPQSHFQALF